jgi:hypothetical protein
VSVRFTPRDRLGLGAPVLDRLAERTEHEYRAGHAGLTLHWTGAGGRLFRPDPVVRLRAMWAYHVRSRGYGDIAYAGAFDADARTFGLRDSRWVGAHARSTGNVANRLTDGIVFLEDSRGWTDGANEGFEWWVNLYRLVHGRWPELWPHRWWDLHGGGGGNTACPGPRGIDVVVFCGGHRP